MTAYTLHDLHRDIDRHIDQKDWKQTRQRLELCISILGKRKVLTEITKIDIRRLMSSLRDRKLSNATINRYMASFGGALTWAVQNDLLDAKPPIPKLPETKGRMAYLTEPEIERMNAQLVAMGRHDLSVVFRTLLVTGLRINELLGPNIRMTPDGAWLHLWDTKNGDERIVPLVEALRRPLAALMASGLPSYPSVRKGLLRASKLAGIQAVTPHVLRHTCATMLTSKDVPTRVIQQYLGHKSINTTLKYAKVEDKTLTNASLRIANFASILDVACEPQSVSACNDDGIGGLARNRTGVQGFAVLDEE